MREKTDLEGVKFVAKQLVMIDIHLTEYSPIVVQHPFTSSGIAAAPSKDGLRLLDITKSEEDLRAWQGYMKGLIDNAKSAYEIYMMVNILQKQKIFNKLSISLTDFLSHFRPSGKVTPAELMLKSSINFVPVLLKLRILLMTLLLL